MLALAASRKIGFGTVAFAAPFGTVRRPTDGMGLNADLAAIAMLGGAMEFLSNGEGGAPARVLFVANDETSLQRLADSLESVAEVKDASKGGVIFPLLAKIALSSFKNSLYEFLISHPEAPDEVYKKMMGYERKKFGLDGDPPQSELSEAVVAACNLLGPYGFTPMAFSLWEYVAMQQLSVLRFTRMAAKEDDEGEKVLDILAKSGVNGFLDKSGLPPDSINTLKPLVRESSDCIVAIEDDLRIIEAMMRGRTFATSLKDIAERSHALGEAFYRILFEGRPTRPSTSPPPLELDSLPPKLSHEIKMAIIEEEAQVELFDRGELEDAAKSALLEKIRSRLENLRRNFGNELACVVREVKMTIS